MTFPLKIIGLLKTKVETKIFEFDVNATFSHNTGFTLTFTGSLTVDWGDGSPPESITSGVAKNHTHPSGGYTVKITGNLNQITKILFLNSQMVAFRFDETAQINDFRIPLQKLSILDLSTIDLINQFYCYLNNSLVSIVGLNGSVTVNQLLFYSCNLPTLDLSNIPVMGLIRGYSNPNLTTITFKSSGNGKVSDLRLYSCNLGYNDFTTGGLNYELNNASIQLQNNGMTAAEVNHILYDIDQSSSGSYTGRTLQIDGTNAAPDGSSGGYNGTAAKASLTSKGWTVTTN